MAKASLDEKAALRNQYTSPAPHPPPAYPQVPPICVATALYAYTPTDAGDLALQPQDRVQVLEHMNDDCMICPASLLLMLELTRMLQGGVVATSGPALKASSREAT